MNLSSSFELPIFYVEEKQRLDENIIEDLELLKVNNTSDNDTEERIGLLETVIQPKSNIALERLNTLSEYYTSDKKFLKDTQKILGSWKEDKNIESKQKQYDEFYELWKNIKNDENFVDRYYYVDIDFFKFLNHSPLFLQILSLYNLVSPVLSLVLPIILLIVPFFMLKFSGITITLDSYYKVLVNIFSKHALGNIFTAVGDISWEKRAYALISVVFYFFSIYQNSLTCYRFYKNFGSIHNDLFLLKEYLVTTIENMNTLEKSCMKHASYVPFVQSIYPHKEHCIKIVDKLNIITQFDLKNLTSKSKQIGYIMKHFYEFHINTDIESTVEFSLGVNAFMEHMNGLNELRREKLINKCKFGKKTKMKNAYFPHIIQNEPVKNDIDLSKNIAITGPNASGKTTTLKSTLLNLIFSQSFGYGFYSGATISPYNRIHCYLNIPDTSGRDSLFQAEARRCKEIIESLEDGKKHFCIFDELFSGTNPNEACASSYGFIKFLIKNKNIDFILTTHLTELCKKINHIMVNNHMLVKEIGDFNFQYTYKMVSGISTVKGGLKVLADLQYPQYILNESIQALKKI
jgi:ABC-type multidrug transport system fused ATPase/permease subunit